METAFNPRIDAEPGVLLASKTAPITAEDGTASRGASNAIIGSDEPERPAR